MNAVPQALDILQTNTRIDGRGIGEMRDIAISFFTSRGSVLVEKGRTKVAASTKLGVVYGSRVKTGHVSVVCNLPPDMKETVEHVNLAEVVNSTFSGDQVIPRDILVIIPGALYFSVHCSVEVLTDDGGLRDACIIAAGTSIYHMGIPNVKHLRQANIGIDNKAQVTDFISKIMALPRDEFLTLRYIPLAVTFGYLSRKKLLLTQLALNVDAEEDEKNAGTGSRAGGTDLNFGISYLIDCCREELSLCESCVTIVLDKSGLTNGLYKLAGAPVSPHDLVQMTVEAHEAVRQASTDIEAAVIADVEKRKQELIERVRN